MFFAAMYFKVSLRHNPAIGKTAGYYRLVESYRNEKDRVCHRTLLNVGFLDDVLTIDQLNLIRRALCNRYESGGNPTLFDPLQECEPIVVTMVNELWSRLVNEKRIDIAYQPKSVEKKKKRTGGGRDWETIDMNSLRHKDVRETGSEWLCLQAVRQLGLDLFLEQEGWTQEETRLAMTHLISRAVHPASELATSYWIRESSAVCELTGYPEEKITKDCLYKISHKLYSVKEKLEDHLSHRTNELFDIEDKIILYDLTNTYFEGSMQTSRLAKFGRSKEKRSDAKLVVLALVINPQGFIKYSSILEGNTADPATLESMIRSLRFKTSTAHRAIVVLDAGIATENNLAMLRGKGYDYICVSRTRLKDYTVNADCDPVVVIDNKKQKITLQKIETQKEDYFLRVESEAKKQKETSMNNLFQERFETGLQKISDSLTKKGGVKREAKVMERIGRLRGKYPSVQKYYHIDLEVETETKKQKNTKNINQENKKSAEVRTVKTMTWTVKETVNSDSGIYFLRTSIDDKEKILWESYNALTTIESTFRVLKTDLDLRPVYHKKDDSTMAHLHLGILAYWLVNTIRYQLRKEGINSCWKEIVRVMNTQKAVTTIAQNKENEIILLRRCSEPVAKASQIYEALKYKQSPYRKKKSVVHKSDFEKNYSDEYRRIRSG